jgi:hypothetical protein
MPSHLEAMFSTDELRTAELVQPFDFTKGAPMMRVQMAPGIDESGLACVANWGDGSCLFDLFVDPGQEHPIDDPQVVDRLNEHIVEHLAGHDAPAEIYAHYGLVGTERSAQVA